MCCATRWQSIAWTSAVCILERQAGRCTRRRTQATPGRRSSVICRRYCRWKCRRWIRTMATIRVALPQHLRTLAHVSGEVSVEIEGPVTQRSVLDAVEARYPMLRGTIREHGTLQRRAFLRFFACEEDLSHESPDAPLPEAVANGKEPFLVIGAIAGGTLNC